MSTLVAMAQVRNSRPQQFLPKTLTDLLVGKTLLMQANIERDANIFVKDSESHWQIICVWQKGAHALIEQYRQLVKNLPKEDNLEITVVTKDELMTMAMLDYMVQNDFADTATQINRICGLSLIHI